MNPSNGKIMLSKIFLKENLLMEDKINPYIVGNAVGNSTAFVGRNDVLTEVKSILRHPQQNTIILFGQRRIGKTSVLRELEARLPQEGAYLPIFFDLQDKASLPLEQVTRELAEKMCQQLNIEKNINLLDLLNNLDTTQKIILLFDEFEAIAGTGNDEERAGTAFFPFWRDHLSKVDPKLLNFVFAIGRKVQDLNQKALSLFKAVPSKRVSLLKYDDTVKLINLSNSKDNQTLKWSDEAIKQIWSQTHGHPYFTQCLCYYIWNELYENEPKEIPSVTSDIVNNAIPKTLEGASTAFQWLWEGLPTTEKLIASILASQTEPVTETELNNLLQGNGIQLIQQEIGQAARILQEWDLVESIEENKFRFRVKLLRLWIVKNKTLEQVQDELDSSNVHAHRFYEAAVTSRAIGQLGISVDHLNNALDLNPNHIKANQLLATLLLQQGKIDEARRASEALYLLRPNTAHPLLIESLLRLIEDTQDEEKKLPYYQRIIEISSEQTAEYIQAQEQWAAIWQRKAEFFEKEGNLEQALEAYKQACNEDKENQIQRKIYEKQGDEAYQKDELKQALHFYKKGRFRKKASQVRQEIYQRQANDAFKQGEFENALKLYEKANLPDKVTEMQQRIYQKQGDDAYLEGNFAEALKIYQEIGLTDKVTEIKEKMLGSEEIESFLTQLVDKSSKIEAVFLNLPEQDMMFCGIKSSSNITKAMLRNVFSSRILQNFQENMNDLCCGKLENIIFPFTNNSVLNIYFIDDFKPLVLYGVITPVNTGLGNAIVNKQSLKDLQENLKTFSVISK
ncbi:MAG: ATP-binding protein, partial [Thiotrichaceae bacterium]|nr:ATP-binding protein [Thiotrichaceae bacterium]